MVPLPCPKESQTGGWQQVLWYARGCRRNIPRNQVPEEHCTLLPQYHLCNASFQGKTGKQDAQRDPCSGEQESCLGENQNRSKRTAFHEDEGRCQGNRGWY